MWQDSIDNNRRLVAAAKAEGNGQEQAHATDYFARGLGFARTGDIAAAEKEVWELVARQDALERQKNTYWANQVDVRRHAVMAWIAWERGNRDEAMKTMRAAADLEDSMEKHIVTPSPVVPARELLGDMLLEAKQPGDALEAFESSAQREPNRLRGLFGAAQAAALSGNRDRAKLYYAKLVALAEKGDGARRELQQARLSWRSDSHRINRAGSTFLITGSAPHFFG